MRYLIGAIWFCELLAMTIVASPRLARAAEEWPVNEVFWVEVTDGPLNIRTCPDVRCDISVSVDRPRQISRVRQGGRIKVLEVVAATSPSGCVNDQCLWGRTAYGFVHLGFVKLLDDPVFFGTLGCPDSADHCLLVDRNQQAAFFVRCSGNSCTIIRATWISTGRMNAPDARDVTPTPLGLHRTTRQLATRTMEGYEADGDYYFLPDIHFVTYFDLVERLNRNGGYDRGMAIHEAYWHSSFGYSGGVSHGCINMSADDAEFVYSFAPLGTQIVVY
ncbi:L,D-transpeptidase [candidate division WWE3 bacterium]|nr:L,D-transpeptidase [candidate division WWE3 bacterium]